jgi:hypothetical protein
MIRRDIAVQRLYNHRLAAPGFSTPQEVVGWMGAVQAQEYAFAKWALAMRMRIDIQDAELEQAFNAGLILRVHVMRPTWHFVLPADVRWMQSLSAQRVIQSQASRYRQLELDEALFARCEPVIVKALEGDKQLTRAELAAELGKAGMHLQGERLGHILLRLEVKALVCSGPRRGKQFTYMLLDERAPHAKSLPRDEALALLTQRYFQSHAPATAQDFAWWSGLTVGDVRTGLEMLKPRFLPEVIDGKTYWHDPSLPELAELPLVVHLLPTYDEFHNGYKDYSPVFEPAYIEQVSQVGRTFSSYYAINGQIAGMWKRTFHKGAVIITRMPFRELSPRESDAFAMAAGCFGEFLNMHVVLA